MSLASQVRSVLKKAAGPITSTDIAERLDDVDVKAVRAALYALVKTGEVEQGADDGGKTTFLLSPDFVPTRKRPGEEAAPASAAEEAAPPKVRKQRAAKAVTRAPAKASRKVATRRGRKPAAAKPRQARRVVKRGPSRGAKSVVVYGPAGCGKTRFAAVLAGHYRLERIEDLVDLDAPIERTGVLYLAQARPHWAEEDARRVVPFHEAMAAAGMGVPAIAAKSAPATHGLAPTTLRTLIAFVMASERPLDAATRAAVIDATREAA